MVTLLGFAMVAAGGYVLLMRRLPHTHPLCVVVGVAAVVSCVVLLAGGLLVLWDLAPALRISVREGRAWVWPSVWRDAAFAAAITVGVAALLAAMFVARRSNHLTRRCS